jgi:hypothetical protein
MKPCWGNEDLRVVVESTMGIIHVNLVNLTSSPLFHVQIVQIMDPEFKPISSHREFDMKPHESKTVHLVHVSPKNQIGSISIHFMDAENTYLMNIIEEVQIYATQYSDIYNIQTWATALREFHPYRRDTKSSVPPAQVVQKFQEKLGVRFVPVETASDHDLIWISLNPPFILNINRSTIKVFTDEQDLVTEIDQNITKWYEEISRNELVKIYFEIGKLIVTLQDYIDLGWYVGEVEDALDRLIAYLEGLKIPNPFVPFKTIITNKRTLSELDDVERGICVQALRNLERTVIPVI